MPNKYEFLCDAHINMVEVDDGFERDQLHFWVRVDHIADDGEPAFRCQHQEHDNAVRVVEAEGNDEHLPPAATWEAWTFEQLENDVGAPKIPEPAVTPMGKLDEIMRLLKADNPAITITYKTSSQPKGQDGIEIRLTERAEAADIIRIADAAEQLFMERKSRLFPPDPYAAALAKSHREALEADSPPAND